MTWALGERFAATFADAGRAMQYAFFPNHNLGVPVTGSFYKSVSSFVKRVRRFVPKCPQRLLAPIKTGLETVNTGVEPAKTGDETACLNSC